MKLEDMEQYLIEWAECFHDYKPDEYEKDTQRVRKIFSVIKAAKEAAKEIDTYYLKMEQHSRTQTISEDDHDLWFVRDEINTAIKDLEGQE